jgi:hypothetical protein
MNMEVVGEAADWPINQEKFPKRSRKFAREREENNPQWD